MDINWDPEDAHRALVRAEGMPSESLKRATIASISAAAQIDIAASLRIIAAEAALAMSGAPLDTDEPDEPEDEEPLVEGDVVLVDGEGEPGTISGFRFTEGEYFAAVERPDGGGLIAVSRLTRLVGDEGDEGGPVMSVQYIAPEGGQDGPLLSIGDRVVTGEYAGVIHGFQPGEDGALVNIDLGDEGVQVPLREVELVREEPVEEEVEVEIEADFPDPLEALKAKAAATKKAGSKKGKKS